MLDGEIEPQRGSICVMIHHSLEVWAYNTLIAENIMGDITSVHAAMSVLWGNNNWFCFFFGLLQVPLSLSFKASLSAKFL